MQPVSTNSAGGACVRLAAISDTSAAAALKADLAPLTGAGGAVRVLADDVERITTGCIQLLLAADAALVPRGGALMVSGATDAMRAAFADLGLAADLQRWTDAHG